jgi:hypothetical protein
MAIEYASSPVAHAGTQTRTVSPAVLPLNSPAMWLSSAAKASASRKKLVTLISMSCSSARPRRCACAGGQVGGQVGHAVDLHPATDSPQDGGTLVVREVAAGACAGTRAPRAGRPRAGPVGRLRRRWVLRAAASGCRPAAGRRRAARASRPTGSIQSTMPVAIAVLGISRCCASSGSCAIVRPPRSLMRLMPMEPSPSAPDSTIAAALRAVRVGQRAEEQVHRHAAARARSSASTLSWPSSDDSALPGGIT